MTNQNNQSNNNTDEKQQALAAPKPQLAMTSNGFMPTNMDEAWRFATALSRTALVPERYRGKPDECLIALDLAARLQCNWLAVMQHSYEVHGRIGFEAKFVTALINRSGLYTDPLEYEVKGEDAKEDDYAVRAYAKSKSTGKVLYGPWITWELVKAEGWEKPKKSQTSKWMTMPEQMFHYRAASWFKNRHCPQITIGVLTTEELEDTPERRQVESMTYEETVNQTQEKIDKEIGSEKVEAKPEPEKEPDAPQEQPQAPTEEKKPAGRGRKPKNKKPEHLYKCNGCKHEFDKPRTSGTGTNQVSICPKCLCKNIASTADQDEIPEWAKEETAA